jgi:multidrug efflux pump
VIGMFTGPEGATLDYMARYAEEIERIYAGLPEVDRYLVIAGNPTVSQGISFVGFTDWAERERKAARSPPSCSRSCARCRA